MANVALRDYLEQLIAAHDRRYEQRFVAADTALTKAEIALRDYKVGSNEWRDALKDQSSRMATREELERLDRIVQQMQQDKAALDGKLLIVASIIAVLFSIITSLTARFIFS